jgi:hypothetical protein
MIHVKTSWDLTLIIWNILYNKMTLDNLCSLVYFAQVAAQYSVHSTPIPRYVCFMFSNAVHQYVCHFCSNAVHHYICHLCSNTVHNYVCQLCSSAVHHYQDMFATCVPKLYTITKIRLPLVSQHYTQLPRYVCHLCSSTGRFPLDEDSGLSNCGSCWDSMGSAICRPS